MAAEEKKLRAFHEDFVIEHEIRRAVSLDTLKPFLTSQDSDLSTYRNSRGSSLLHIATYYGKTTLAKGNNNHNLMHAIWIHVFPPQKGI